MVGLLVAAVVVTLVQFLRRRDKRLVPLAILLALMAGAESRERGDPWRRYFIMATVASAWALLGVLSFRDDSPPRPGDKRP